LGLSRESDAIQALLNGRARRIDVIEINCLLDGEPIKRYALLFAAVGIIGDLLRLTTPVRKRWLGRTWAYRLGLVQALSKYCSPSMRVRCEDQKFEDRFLLACASNGECAGGGIKLAPGAQIDDGLLNANLIRSMNRWEAFGQLRTVASGRHTTHPKVRYAPATLLTVEAAETLAVAADGELLGQIPARFEVKPRALSVLTREQKKTGF
jgi:diacylglycerol kinase family enzyme